MVDIVQLASADRWYAVYQRTEKDETYELRSLVAWALLEPDSDSSERQVVGLIAYGAEVLPADDTHVELRSGFLHGYVTQAESEDADYMERFLRWDEASHEKLIPWSESPESAGEPS